MRLYFAYGSNMDRAHMAKLCRGADAMGAAQAENQIFYIAASGYASLAPRRNARVHGVLWRIGPPDRARLDAYEEVQTGLYRAAAIPVHHDGRLMRALVYYAIESRPGRARPGYQEKVVAAAREWHLPADYVRELENFLPRP